MLLAQAIADRLQRRHVIDGGKGVVHRGEADPGLLRLPLRPVVAVAQLGAVGEVAAELDDERAEVLIHAVRAEVVNLQRRAGQPQVLLPGRRVTALLGAEHPRLLLDAADEQHPVSAAEVSQVSVRDGVLVLALPSPQPQPCTGMLVGMGRSPAMGSGRESRFRTYGPVSVDMAWPFMALRETGRCRGPRLAARRGRPIRCRAPGGGKI